MKFGKEKKKTAGRRYLPSIEILYRTEIFFAVLSCSLAVIYAVGNYQYFLDSSLLALLRMLSVSALLDIFLSAVVIFRECVSFAGKKHRIRLPVILSSVFFAFLSGFFLFFAHLLLTVSSGF